MAEPQSTVDRAAAYVGLSEADHRILQTRLLVDILLASSPMADVTVAGIISRAQAGGITGLPKDVHRILQTQLLRDIVDAGVGGGGGSPSNNLVSGSDGSTWRLTLTKVGPAATADQYVLDWVAP